VTTRLVLDTSALLSLALIHRLDLLRALEVEPVICEAVRQELEIVGRRSDALAQAARDALDVVQNCVVPLTDLSRKLADRLARIPRLGRGEAESVALAVQLGAQDVVIDDLEALGSLAGMARTLNVGILASPYLIVSAYVTGQMTFDQAADLLRWLANARGWYNSSLYIVALATLERTREQKEVLP